MLNIIGITLSFLGTVLTLSTLVFSKPNKNGTTWGEVQNLSPNQYKTKIWSIIGLTLITIGFVLQLYVAIESL